MKLIKPSIEVLKMDDIKLIEIAGRTCYKSEDKITEDSAKKFVEMLIKRGHEAMVEHATASVKVICDRGVTHEIVRHRLFSFAQESTRYVRYDGKKSDVTYILPVWFNKTEEELYQNGETKQESLWLNAMIACEQAYTSLLNAGWQAQQARAVLPNSLKTEIIITGNFREWRHFFKLRCAEAAHPQMREVADMILAEFERLQPDMIWR